MSSFTWPFLASLPLLLAYAIQSYKAYLSVGPGGFAQTTLGFGRCLAVKLLLRATGANPLDVDSLQAIIDKGCVESKGWLSEKDVPFRAGERKELCP